jgi:ligand-binding sensor domain-containing protein
MLIIIHIIQQAGKFMAFRLDCAINSWKYQHCYGRILFLLLLLVGSERIGAQMVQRITVEDGLSQGFVMNILQDPEGLVWMGTMDGLNCYNGNGILVWRPNKQKPGSLAGSMVRKLFIDSHQRLWVGSDRGLQVMDRKKGVFYSPQCLVGQPAFQVVDIAEDAQHRIWFIDGYHRICYLQIPATATDYESLERNTNLVTVSEDDPRLIHINCLEPEGDQMLIGTFSGIFSLKDGETAIKPYAFNGPDQKVFCIWHDAQTGELWYQFEKTLVWVHPAGIKTFKTEPMISSHLRGGIIAGGTRYFWGTNAIYLLDKNSTEFQQIPVAEQIISGMSDNQGNLWVGTNARGVVVVRLEKSMFSQYLEGFSVSNFYCPEEKNQLWVLDNRPNADKRYHLFDFAHGAMLQPLRHLEINFVITPDPVNGYWILDTTTSLIHINAKNGRIDRQFHIRDFGQTNVDRKKPYYTNTGKIMLLYNFNSIVVVDPVTGAQEPVQFIRTLLHGSESLQRVRC